MRIHIDYATTSHKYLNQELRIEFLHERKWMRRLFTTKILPFFFFFCICYSGPLCQGFANPMLITRFTRLLELSNYVGPLNPA